MYLNIEIIGLPASGKTFFLSCLNKKLNKKKNNIKICNYKEILLSEYLRSKTKVNLLKKKAYLLYIKNFQVKSKFLFKKEFKDFSLFIKQKLKLDKNYKKVFSIYKEYVETSNYTNERKVRMLNNFKFDFLGAKLNSEKNYFNIIDEGFFQKIFFNFECMTNLKFNLNKQKQYLNLVPRPDLIILMDTSIKTCIKRAKLRVDGFLYNHKLINNTKKNYFNKSVINFAKKNNIPIITFNANNLIKHNIKMFFKKIEKYNN